MVEVLDRIAECASRPRRATLAASASQGSSIFRIFVEVDFSCFCSPEFICLATPPDPYAWRAPRGGHVGGATLHSDFSVLSRFLRRFLSSSRGGTHPLLKQLIKKYNNRWTVCARAAC